MEILTFEKEINKIDVSELTHEHYVRLKNIVIEMIPEERQEKYERIAEVFFKVLSLTEVEQVNTSVIDIIIELCDMIAVSEIECNKGSYAFIKFLYFLKSDSKFHLDMNNDDLLRQYSLFGDIIEQVSWVFSIKKNEKIIFPLYELLSKLAMDFKCDNESLVRLAIALQLFSMANEWIQMDDGDETRQRILKIANDYHIRFLQYLLNGGKIAIKSNENYIKNGTLIFQCDNDLLIRNTSRSYFDSDPNCACEVDDSGNPIAFYVELKKPERGNLTSFVELFSRENDYHLKLEVLDEIFCSKNFNILYDDLIFVDNTSSRFICFFNKFGKNDRYIIYDGYNINSSLLNFLSILKKYIKDIRGSILYKDGMDILTLDFLISIFDFIPTNIDLNLTSICDGEHEDFFQNLIIKKCFEEVKRKSVDSYSEMLFKYSDYYLEYFSNINLNKNMSEMKGLIMPYKLYFDFANMEEFYSFEKEKIFGQVLDDEIVWGTLRYEESPIPKFVDTETENIVNLVDFEGNHIDSFQSERKIGCFINKVSKKAYYNQELYTLYKGINRLIHWNAKSRLVYADFRSIDERELNSTAKIINLIKLKEINYIPFNLEFGNMIIPYYKILWHFSLHQWDLEKVKSFFDLVLNRHYTDSVLHYKDSFKVFDEIEDSEDSILYIAKEREENQGTLYMLYTEYIQNYGKKYHLNYMFSSETIKNHLKVSNNKYYFNSKKIEKIVIVSDMLMNGKAMIDALNYYFKDTPNEIKKFVDVADEIKSILDSNKEVKIEVISLWGYSSSISNIKEKFSDIDISIKISNVIPEEYRCDEETNKILTELYNCTKTNGLCCTFRYNNMPACSVFPNYVIDTTKIGGIFNRKDEL